MRLPHKVQILKWFNGVFFFSTLISPTEHVFQGPPDFSADPVNTGLNHCLCGPLEEKFPLPLALEIKGTGPFHSWACGSKKPETTHSGASAQTLRRVSQGSREQPGSWAGMKIARKALSGRVYLDVSFPSLKVSLFCSYMFISKRLIACASAGHPGAGWPLGPLSAERLPSGGRSRWRSLPSPTPASALGCGRAAGPLARAHHCPLKWAEITKPTRRPRGAAGRRGNSPRNWDVAVSCHFLKL